MAIDVDIIPQVITKSDTEGSQIHNPECDDVIKKGRALIVPGMIPISTEGSTTNSFSVSIILKILDFGNPIDCNNAYSGICSHVILKMTIPSPAVPINNPKAPNIRKIFR